MKKITQTIIIVFSLFFFNNKLYAQLHTTPNCGQNFNLVWTTSTLDDNCYWPPGQLTNTYFNVDNSGTDITIEFTGETNTLGFWSGQTPKVGTQSSYLYKGIDLLSNGFSGTGITCTITFSKPIYAISFDIHHVNRWEANGDKYTFTGKNMDGNIIYPEFTNAPSPTYTSDNNTGIVNAISNITSGNNAIVGVNFSDSKYIKSISFLWDDCETCSTNLPHATGIGNFSFCTPQKLDFDGVNDYISRSPFLGGNSEVTMMSWIKLDNEFNSGEIMGEQNFRLFVNNEKKLKASIKTDTNITINSPSIEQATINENKWYHVALKFDNNTGKTTMYLNGKDIWMHEDSALIGSLLMDYEESNSNYDFEIGRNTEFQNDYFKGSIYETRVYKKALSLNQLHQQINQEIENNNGNVRGNIIPKDIDELFWDDLILYYKMGVIDTGYTPDNSNSKINGKLHNMTTFQDYTAPLPYESTKSSNGNWTESNNWLHGSVWTINQEIPEHAIIQIKGNLELDLDVSTTGIIIDKDANLIINNNSGLSNSWYLKLDGKIDLEGESQLIQTQNSTLDIISSGILEKDLQGTADKFTYNYWSSPVSKSNNITNNNKYTVKDVFTNVSFISTGYDGISNPLSIADYWIWKYNNKLTDHFASWQQIRSTGEIIPGEGFTMKGPGTGSINEEQNYILQGKPNNGDIHLDVYAANNYLIGNPYPSAIDAVKFLMDNKSTINNLGPTNGTLYFWKHWGGGSHIANDYQGGYATFSLSGGVPAASKNTTSYLVSTGGTPIEIPQRYIKPGKGFYITAEANSTLKFNNSQRVFQIENKNTSTIIKNNSLKKISKYVDSRMKLRIGFNSVNALRRQLLVTVDENATSGFDWGYDSKNIDTQIDDMYWLIDNQKCTIQGINEINKETIIPLGIHSNIDGFNSIMIDKLENTNSSLEIYLHDKELGIYHDLILGKCEIYFPAGEYLNRFEITFTKNQTLISGNIENKEIEVYFSNGKNKIIINNPSLKFIETVEMFNILGQSLFKFQTNTYDSKLEYNASQIKPGYYVLKIETQYGLISKKVLVK
ncbi:MAG: T9SS type A sorting domain-containing protein [Flaviramulus sp.]|nr:T9SS type A sorting domain-containing protein [Flaviramulus sp.]